MRARTWVAAVAAAAAVTAGLACSSPSPPAPPAPPPHSATASPSPSPAASHTQNHVVKATARGTGLSASVTVTDPFAAGAKLDKIEYHLHDGYSKRVIIPGGAFVTAEDIAICGEAGLHYPNNGFAGTGLECHPFLHQQEIFYHQHVGTLAGRYHPHHNVEVTEICHGTGRYLTVGHIDHGALLSAEYYWANGEHLTVELPGNALVDHIVLVTTGSHLSAAEVRHP
ncbi:MAG TPA: hypothetical protein VG123_40460 [Streptosporangiaceae bacterium]|nr:hypothetical protein [Streptosporangiaceae bacterium]